MGFFTSSVYLDILAHDPIDRAIQISDSNAKDSGLSGSQVRIKQKYGGGYPANVEGFHHLKCLVSLTQPSSQMR